MSPKKAGLIAVGALVLAGGWYAFRPERLFLNRTVAEQFPAADAGSTEVVLSGRFHGNAHETTGRATIYRLPTGGLMLRLTEFATSNGPDVRVYLVAATDVTDDETVSRAGFVELGPMKGNRGDQNYEVPAGIDLSRYRAVTIWCRRFSVNFGTAPLS
jgi:hypothetical protein